MIEGYCHTNIDDYKKEIWPRMFVAVPRLGERVAAESGMSLVVVGITHMSAATPYVRIELYYGR